MELKGYKKACESTANIKNEVVVIIKDSLENRLEYSVEDHSAISAKILNTEGWICAKDDINVFDDDVETAYNSYTEPLKKAGFNGTFVELLDKWHTILEYTVTYLAPIKIDYRTIWYQLFNSSRAKEWSNVLLLAELLFFLPISNAKVERFFHFMNRVKTDTRSSLGEKRLNTLLCIAIEGPAVEEFELKEAMNLWYRGTTNPRCPNQIPCKEYKSQEKHSGAATLIDIEVETEEISEEQSM